MESSVSSKNKKIFIELLEMLERIETKGRQTVLIWDEGVAAERFHEMIIVLKNADGPG